MFFSSKKIIGLDIGSSTIKIAEVNLSGSKAEVVSFALAPTPNGAVENGEIVNQSNLGTAVAGLVADLHTKTKKLAVGMWGTSVIVKKITIPAIDRKLIADQMRWEAEQYIPFEKKEIALAHHVIENVGPSETQDVLLVAAQNGAIAQYNQIAEDAGLKLEILDVGGFALANAFELNYGRKMGEAIAILNIGASNTNFVVVHNGEVIFSRDMPVGGSNYTNEIQKELGISFTEAESMKLSFSNRGEVPPQVNSVIGSANEAMTEEIRNGFDFFAASTTGVTISRCYFAGGGSMIPGMIEKVSQMANVPAERLNSFARIKPGKLSMNYVKQINLYAPIALGLAARKVGDS